MPDHAKEYSFDVIEQCAQMKVVWRIWISRDVKVLQINWMFTIMQISLWRVHFAQLDADWRKWTYFRIIVWLLVQVIAHFL